MNLVEGSFQFLLYRCPCLKTYCNHWYHWQPLSGPRSFVSPGVGQVISHQLHSLYCELTQSIWSAALRAVIFHGQHQLSSQLCRVVVGRIRKVSFAQPDSWNLLIGSPASQIHGVSHSTHKQIAKKKKVLCSHVGLFMCEYECVLIMCI